jgi:hypothetical protein
MARAEILTELDKHLSNGGMIDEFNKEVTSEDLTERNVLSVIHHAQHLYEHFPLGRYKEGSDVFRTAAKIGAKSPEFDLATVAQSAATLLDFSSYGSVDLIFEHDSEPPRIGYVTPGWSSRINIEPDSENFGIINFERNFYLKSAGDSRDRIRLMAAVYGAGYFLELMDKKLTGLSSALNMPRDKLRGITLDCFNTALSNQIGFYQFLQLMN